ncbi:MAG: DNA polymerase III subunit delta' C-terminal domain-containing protein [Eubacteriales bacterium]|nr:DNA polymerase III subunit delta' C-terminal domain-containing protein [Eubacteriales bacterium]
MTDDTARHRFLSVAENRNIQGPYLIICARPGVSKRLADTFLMRLYCKKGGCGDCADCRKVTDGHVDIMRLSAPKVAEFREAISFIAEKAYEGGYKAVVIENADDMTDAAANSMLKSLEQPPKDTVIILQARSASGVLPTVASRCAAVYLAPEKNAVRAIADTLKADDTAAHILSDLSGGYVDEAALLYQDTGFWDARSAVLEICQKLLSQKSMAISAYADCLEANKDRLLPLLSVMQSYYRDIHVYMKTNNKNLIINRDQTDSITNAALHFTSGAISNMISAILKAERRFFFPVNFRLAVEKMFFDMLEEKNRWKK